MPVIGPGKRALRPSTHAREPSLTSSVLRMFRKSLRFFKPEPVGERQVAPEDRRAARVVYGKRAPWGDPLRNRDRVRNQESPGGTTRFTSPMRSAKVGGYRVAGHQHLQGVPGGDGARQALRPPSAPGISAHLVSVTVKVALGLAIWKSQAIACQFEPPCEGGAVHRRRSPASAASPVESVHPSTRRAAHRAALHPAPKV